MNPSALSIRVKNGIKKSITSELQVPSKIAKRINMQCNESINDELKTDLPTEEEEEKIEEVLSNEYVRRFIGRGVEEVGKIISDLNFDLNNQLKHKSSTIKSINFPEDGSAVVSLNSQYEIDDVDVVSNLTSKLEKYSLRPDFSRFVSYTMLPPDTKSPHVRISTKVKIPKGFVEELVGSPAGEAWGKRSKIIEKYAKSLLSSINK